MSTGRLSLENVEHGKNVEAARGLEAQMSKANLQLVNRVAELNAHRTNEDREYEDDDGRSRDPAIVAQELADQITYLRKLKFQYLEQNAKDKYVKSIVSDIDDAPIVTAEENKELAQLNEEKKAKLKEAKGRLAEVQNNIRLLGPLVDQDYQRVTKAIERASLVGQKIIEARTALLLLRQTHPRPRLTILLAEEKLQDQVDEMQSLNDQVQASKQQGKADKARVKAGTLEVEALRTEAGEAERAVKAARLEEDDSRLVPLFEWYTASLALHRSISGLEESETVSDRELHLTFKVDGPAVSYYITIELLFFQDSQRRLEEANVEGLTELGVDGREVVAAHVASNDVHGLVEAVLALARAAANVQD